MIEDYVRNAQLVRVIDGDTYELNIDLGFRIWKKDRVRLYGVNCPEIRGPELKKGLAAKIAVQEWFDKHEKLQIKTHSDKYDSFGRLLADVWSEADELSQYILATGHGTVLEDSNRGGT